MADKKIYSASTTAPVNIAVVKYWGKRDAKLNLPTNSSLSPAAALSPRTPSRQTACFRELKALRKKLEDANPSLPKLSEYHVHIVSENNFPTAAGLASSAAGFAALVRAIANLYELPESPTELSKIARQGSGSACRSLFGGYVAWEMGQAVDGSDSCAVEVAPASHWPELKAAILVVSAAKKGVSSTAGMQATVNTSALFAHRARDVVPKRMEAMRAAIRNRDFERFAAHTMADSNQFHAVCLDTTPPIFYMNDVSRAAIRAIEALNTLEGRVVGAYTFDAGPNAVIYYREKDEEKVLGFLGELLAPEVAEWAGKYAKVALEGYDNKLFEALKDGVSRVILTRVGEGPIRTDDTLIGTDGLPSKK
ncbi:Diphosphomevalonate decarboxylase [Tuber magnatum]|uniref:Diphosphomevalonate decarboxylase n=1 Tax=Tuber magnatum TaxID=42249 RepID=A0A317SUV6_9PEZI|nr:Diphosphomevalonate decarboxylase [Tuber magnatum]